MVFAGDNGNFNNLQESRLRFVVEDQASKKIAAIESQVSKLSTAATGLKFATDAVKPALGGINFVVEKFRQKLLELPKSLENAIAKIRLTESIFTKLNITLLGFKGLLEVRKGFKEVNLELTGVNRSLKLLDDNTGALDKLAQLKTFREPTGLLALFGKEGQSNITKAVSQYNNFNEALSRLNTVFLNNDEEIRKSGLTIDEYGKRIQDLVSKDLKNAVSSTEALAGAYEVASGGFKKAADNSQVLTAGLKLATSAQADNASTLRLLVQTLKAYDLGAEKAADTAAKLYAIVENGITTISELNIGFAQTAGVAAQAGISVDELGGLVSELTKATSTPIALTQIQALARVISSGRLQENADKLNLTINGARLQLSAADIKANGLVNTFKALKEATQGNSETLVKLTQDFNAYKALVGVVSKDLDRFSNLISKKIGVAAAESLNKVFGIRIDNSQTQKLIAIVNKATESIIRIGRIAAPFFESGLESLNTILEKTEAFIVENEGLITTAIKASLAYNSFLAVIGTVAKTVLSLIGIFVTLRILNGQFFKDLGNLFRVTKRLDENANVLQIINNRIKNNTLVQAQGLGVREKLLIVLRNLTGIRAVEKIQLDEQNKVVKVFNKGIGAQISGVNSLSTALANLGDRVLPGLGDRYKKSIAEITKTDLKPPEIEGGKLDFTPASKDAERELSGFKKARILASSSAKTFGENLKNSFDRAKNSLIDFLQPNARFNEIYQRQIEIIEANTRSQIRNNIERGKTRRLTEQEIALQAKANKATRIRTVFTTDLALTYEKLTGRVSGFLDRLTDSKFSKALEEQRKAIEAQNVLVRGTPLTGADTDTQGVLATNTAKLTAAQKAQAATAAIVSVAQENIGRKTSVLSSVYARQVQQIKTLQAEKNYLAGINKVVGVSFDQLTSSVRANAIANTQLNATQKAQAVASTAGILAARTTADARQKLEFAYKRELIQLRRLQAAKKLGIPIEEAATNATVRQTARTQIQVGVLGQLRSRIASLNVLFPTFAKGVTLVGGALGGVLGVVRSLIATIAPMLILATAFKAFTFITNLMEDAKQLEKGLVEVSESTREVLGITSDLGKIDTYQKLEKETLRWDNAVEKVWSKIQDIGFFLTEPLTIAFQTNSLENASKIIDLVGEAQLRSRKTTLDLNQAFSETGKAGKILQGSFNASSEAISQYEKIAGVALQKASEDLEKNKQAIAITQKTLENFQRVRDERLAKGGQKVKEQESFKLLESSIKDLEMTLKMATTEADRLSASINLITEANKQRAIIQQQLNTSNIDYNQSTLANKLAFATKNANQELNKQLGLLKLVREDFNKLDPKKDLKKVTSATESIKDLTNKIEKSALAQVSAIQKRFENNFITAKQAREEIEAILATGFDIDDETRSTLEKLLKPETLQQFLDARRDLIKEEVENNKTLYEKEAQLYQQLQENKLITAAEATTKIGALNIKLAQEDLRFIEESLKKESITEQERERLRFERLAKQKQILDLELKQRVNFLNQALREEEDFFKKRLDLLQTYANNQLANSISNQKNLEKLQLEQARNTVEQLNNQFQQLKSTPEINPQQLAKAEQELLTARAKFEVLEVKIQEERGKRALKQLENRGKKELLQLKLLNDKTLESRERIAAKEIEIRREVLLQEESLLKQRLETARKFGADTSEIEVQLLETQLKRIEQTSSAISQQFEREANRLKAIADKFATEADIKLTQQEQLKSAFDLQVKALEQRNALSSLFQNFQIKSLESASRLTKSRVAQIGIERELLKAQEAAAVRQASIERKRFELKQREKDFELEILAIKTKAEAAQSKSDLANAIAKQKQLELSKTATAEEKEAASLQVEAAKENLKAQLLQTQQLESRRQLRANERIIEKQQLEQQLQARRDSLEERRVSLTKSTADDARLARERVKRARSIVTPQFERTREREPLSITLGGKEFTSREAVKLEPRKSGLKQVEIPRREDLIDKPQPKEKQPLSITINGKKFTSRQSIKLEPTKPDQGVTFKEGNLRKKIIFNEEPFYGSQVINEANKLLKKGSSLKMNYSLPKSAISEIENRFKGLEGFNKNILTSNTSIINFDKSLNLASKGFQELSKNMGNLFKNTDSMDLGQKMKDSEIKTKDGKGVKNITFNPIIEININQSEGETPLNPEAIGDVVLDKLNSVADKLLRQV